jgi:acyl-CoA thioesterase
MLFDMQSVKTAGGRGMNIGLIYNETGELAITTTQEALIRLNKKPAPGHAKGEAVEHK